MEIALDEALSLTGLAHDCWVICDVPLAEGSFCVAASFADLRGSSGATSQRLYVSGKKADANVSGSL